MGVKETLGVWSVPRCCWFIYTCAAGNTYSGDQGAGAECYAALNREALCMTPAFSRAHQGSHSVTTCKFVYISSLLLTLAVLHSNIMVEHLSLVLASVSATYTHQKADLWRFFKQCLSSLTRTCKLELVKGILQPFTESFSRPFCTH